MAKKIMLVELQTDVNKNSINVKVLSDGELLELAQVVSHLQEENDMLWAKVKSSGQAMNDVHRNSQVANSQGAQARQDALNELQAEAQRHRETQAAHLQKVAEAERLAQQLAGKQAEAELLKSKLEDTMRLASQEDEAKLKKDRRMLTRELLEVESQLVQTLNEREEVKKLLCGDEEAQLDHDYWAPAIAIVNERGSMHNVQQELATSLQEAQLQNRSLASNVVDLENQLMQATSSLATWNEAFRAGRLQGARPSA